MNEIFSKINKNLLLHLNLTKNEIAERKDFISPNEFLQVATMKLSKSQTFKTHKHIWKTQFEKKIIAQEAWVVISGSVKVFYYDIDDSFIKSVILSSGDCTITLQGGHNYESLEDHTLVYEFKTGPYEGIEKDKILI